MNNLCYVLGSMKHLQTEVDAQKFSMKLKIHITYVTTCDRRFHKHDNFTLEISLAMASL